MRLVFVALSVLVAIALPLLSGDFGITEDEQLHNNHGKSILDYFLGESDAATRHPIDRRDRLEFAYDKEARDLSGALNIYGGVFDLLCAATRRWASPLGEFENRHLVNSLFGALLIVFTGLTAAAVAGYRAGVLALLLAALSPRIVGHSMNNPVDVPFAALYIFTIYFILRFMEQLPRPSVAVCAGLLLGIPLATDVRISGLVLIAYLLLFVSIWCGERMLAGDAGRGKAIVRALLVAGAISTGGYLLTSALWPLAHRDPLGTPLLAFRHLSRLTTFNAYDLFEGRWINRWEIPWYYVPKWLLIGTPLFVPLGLLLAPLAFLPSPTIDRRKLGLVAFTALFPVVFVIVRGSNVYNDARHVLFAYPPLLACCAVAFESLLVRAKRPLGKAAVALAFSATLAEPLHFMVRNHPNEVVYFSPLVGGVNGAWRRYETDYWGSSVRQAVEWIQTHARPAEDGPVRIRMWYGDQTKARYYIDKRSGFRQVPASEESSGWDYSILPTVECKYTPERLQAWPPAGTVYEVKADDVPLTAVLINHRNREAGEVLGPMRAWAEQEPAHHSWYALALMLDWYERRDEAREAYARAAELPPEPVGRTHDEYIQKSLELHSEGRFEESILLCRMALHEDPRSATAYNNVCAAYSALERWDDARRACERALVLEPGHVLARGNLDHVNRALAPEVMEP